MKHAYDLAGPDNADGDFERTPPHDVAAEQCVLGGMLLSKDAISDVIEVIRPADHYRPAHQLIHEAVLDLYGRGEPADAITVANELTRRGEIARVGGGPYLHTLIASVPTAANAGYYARIVRERAILRRLVEAGTRIVQFGYAGEADADDLVDRAQAEVYSVTDRRTSEDYHSLSEIMPGALDEIEAIGSRGGGLTGVPTGFSDLDALTNGLHPGQMIVIAARPAVGKALALDTPLPTPTGWTTMGAVRVGDHLLGADGQPTQVVAATEVMHARPCYEVEFDDGTVIVADENHQWLTWSHLTGRSGLVPPQVVTTGGIRRTLRCEPGLRRSNHAVARSAAVPSIPHADPRPERWHYIVAVRPAPTRPVKCVQVDSRNHLYLASRGMIPTHNSTLALDFARAAAIRHNLATVLFSLEMGRNEITMRLLSAEARVPMHTMRTGQMNDDDWARLARRMSEVADAPFFIDDSPNMSLMEIRAKCRRLKQRHDLKFILVDYLQLMSSPRRVENRQQEVSEMSRSLKLLAKELDVPVVALSQLNRGPEQRTDKKPLLSDLRECVTADTLITRCDTGERVPIQELAGKASIPVWTLDEHLRLHRGVMTQAWRTGVKPVYLLRLASGREVKATANHPFLTIDGWAATATLKTGSHVAVARALGEPSDPVACGKKRLILLAHLIGDGTVLPHRCITYTTADPQNAQAVIDAARSAFGARATQEPDRPGRAAVDIRLTAPGGNRWDPGALRTWLADTGIYGCRSWEKFIPPFVFRLPSHQLRLFLRHLWATGGSVTTTRNGDVYIYYGTTSRRLADDVQALLLRCGISARLRATTKTRYRQGWIVDVSGVLHQRIFLESIGVYGARADNCTDALRALEGVTPNPNTGCIPREVWDQVRAAMVKHQVTSRELARRLSMTYCGSTLYKHGVSQARMRRVADAVREPYLPDLASSDVSWDRIVSIKPIGEQEVYDVRVPGTHSFLANDIISHNSGAIEQDSDVVILLHREDIYEKESPRAGEADLIVAKHRNGPTGTITVTFRGAYSCFTDITRG